MIVHNWFSLLATQSQEIGKDPRDMQRRLIPFQLVNLLYARSLVEDDDDDV